MWNQNCEFPSHHITILCLFTNNWLCGLLFTINLFCTCHFFVLKLCYLHLHVEIWWLVTSHDLSLFIKKNKVLLYYKMSMNALVWCNHYWNTQFTTVFTPRLSTQTEDIHMKIWDLSKSCLLTLEVLSAQDCHTFNFADLRWPLTSIRNIKGSSQQLDIQLDGYDKTCNCYHWYLTSCLPSCVHAPTIFRMILSSETLDLT